MTDNSPAKTALEQFTEYFVKNYPGPDTIIYNPNWHAPRIFRAAQSAIRAETAKNSGEVVGWFAKWKDPVDALNPEMSWSQIPARMVQYYRDNKSFDVTQLYAHPPASQAKDGEATLTDRLRDNAISANVDAITKALCIEAADHIDGLEIDLGRIALATPANSRAEAPEPVYKAVERILDDHSAWIERPHKEVTEKIALAATIAAHHIIQQTASANNRAEAIAWKAIKRACVVFCEKFDKGPFDELSVDDQQRLLTGMRPVIEAATPDIIGAKAIGAAKDALEAIDAEFCITGQCKYLLDAALALLDNQQPDSRAEAIGECIEAIEALFDVAMKPDHVITLDTCRETLRALLQQEGE